MKLTKEDLEKEINVAKFCSEVVYPIEKQREILRLARLGIWAEEHGIGCVMLAKDINHGTTATHMLAIRDCIEIAMHELRNLK